MPARSVRKRAEPPIEYRDPKGRVRSTAEITQLRVISPAIDGPNLCLVIRFECDGEEIFARWIGDPFAWQSQQTMHRLFAAAAPLNNG